MRFKVLGTVCFVLIIGLVLLGCAPKEDSKKGSPQEEKEVQVDGKDLIERITEKDDYKKWQLWPGKGKLYKSSSPAHQKFLTTYVSDNAVSTIKDKKGDLPDESIIVKENYDGDKKLKAVTVMYKVKGYDPVHNDWFWLEYFPDEDNEIEYEGKAAVCISCHSQKDKNDYLFTSELRN